MAQQGGRLSDRQITNFGNQLAGIAKGYYDLAKTVGAPLPGHEEAIARISTLPTSLCAQNP
jgi:hypothetical protein